MNPLEQLKDIHLPTEIGMWPPAYGWWIVAMLGIILLLSAFIWLRKHHSARLAKRQALIELSAITQDERDWPQQLNRLLKRLSLTYFPDAATAKLHGKAWSDFLASQLCPKKRAEFLQQFLLLQRALYRNTPDKPADFGQSTLQIRQWIKHAVPPKKQLSDHASPVPQQNAQGAEHV
jgi:hypothetical protein